MNDAEPLIDAGAIGYAIKSVFETVDEGFPHITNVDHALGKNRLIPDLGERDSDGIPESGFS